MATKSKTDSLVIVESPAKAKTINKYLGSRYLVVASMGHVRDLPKSKLGVEVMDGFKPNYIIVQRAKKTVSKLKKDAKGKAHIYLATDPDREGEAISWHLAHIFEGLKASVERVVFNEITKDAVEKAFHHPRAIDQKLVDAQQARRILDRLFGYNLSPLLWKKVSKGLSAGRVQSVALRLIVDREEEIRRFVPEEYWSIGAKFRKQDKSRTLVFAELDKVEGEPAKITKQDEAERVKKLAEIGPFEVIDVQRKERKRRPTPPYTTSKLQQDAYRQLRYTSARTMRAAQKLYEGVELGSEGSVGLITYMRTDAVFIGKEAQAETLKFIAKQFGKEYVPAKPNFYKSKKNAQEAHEAIRPTSVWRTPDDVRSFLDDEEWKVYSLIWKKFVASQMTEALEESTAALIESGKKCVFRANGTRTLFAGYLAVYQEPKTEEDEEEKSSDEKTRELPALEKGETLDLDALLPEQHFTKPPARFNDATLVKALEEDGIGRPSTYAPTIQVLITRHYVSRESNALYPSKLGETVAKLLIECFPELLDIKFTAMLEDHLDEVEEGRQKWETVVQEFYDPFSRLIQDAGEKMRNVKREVEATDEICEKCGKPMVIRMSKFGRFMACSGFPECKNTKALTTNIVCPEPGCGGKLVERRGKGGRTFYGCSKFPKCSHISNRLPKDTAQEGEKPAENPSAAKSDPALPAEGV